MEGGICVVALNFVSTSPLQNIKFENVVARKSQPYTYYNSSSRTYFIFVFIGTLL